MAALPPESSEAGELHRTAVLLRDLLYSGKVWEALEKWTSYAEDHGIATSINVDLVEVA